MNEQGILIILNWIEEAESFCNGCQLRVNDPEAQAMKVMVEGEIKRLRGQADISESHQDTAYRRS